MTHRDIKPDKPWWGDLTEPDGIVPIGRPSKSDCSAIRPLWATPFRPVNIEAESFVLTRELPR